MEFASPRFYKGLNSIAPSNQCQYSWIRQDVREIAHEAAYESRTMSEPDSPGDSPHVQNVPLVVYTTAHRWGVGPSMSHIRKIVIHGCQPVSIPVDEQNSQNGLRSFTNLNVKVEILKRHTVTG